VLLLMFVVCVCLLDIALSCALTAEPVEMLFGVCTWEGSKNHVLGGLRSARGKGNVGHPL